MPGDRLSRRKKDMSQTALPGIEHLHAAGNDTLRRSKQLNALSTMSCSFQRMFTMAGGALEPPTMHKLEAMQIILREAYGSRDAPLCGPEGFSRWRPQPGT